MSCGDYDLPSCSTEKIRKARKGHKCCACSEKILKGYKYKYYSGVWDGKPDSFKYCLRCAAIIDEITGRGECYQHTLNCGHSWEDVFCEDLPDEVARLAFKTSEEMQEEFEHSRQTILQTRL